MANKRELEIIATFKDFVSKRLQGLQGAVVKVSGFIRQMGDALKKSGQQMAELGQKALFLGAAITGPLGLAFRNAEQYSARVAQQIQRMKDVSTAFQVSIAEAMVPVVEKLINVLAHFLNVWNSLPPATQQMIVQGALVTGVLLTLSGVVLSLVGKLVSMGGTIVAVAGKFATFAAANPWIFGVAAAVVYLIHVLQELGVTTNQVLNVIEAGFKVMAFNATTAFRGIATVLEKLFAYYEALVGVLAKIPGPLGKINSIVRDDISNLRKSMKGLMQDSDEMRQKLAADVMNIAQGNDGGLVRRFEDIKSKVKDFYDLLKNPPNIDIQPIVKNFNAVREIIVQTAQSLQSNLGDALFKVFTGDFKSIKDVVRNFGRDILQILSQVIAKMILMKTIGSIALPGGGFLGSFFANGGVMTSAGAVPLRKYSSGGIANSPQMAVFGEGSRPEAFVPLPDGRRIPVALKGGGGGNVTIQPVVVIQTLNPADFMRNRDVIVSMVSDSIMRNGSIRKAMKANG